MKNILLIGGGGHCASVADVLFRTNEYDKIGIVDIEDQDLLFGIIPVVGTDDDLSQLRKDYDYAFITVGSIGDTSLRERLLNNVLTLGFSIPNIVDPSAVISEYTTLASGIFIGKNAVVNSRVDIGEGVIVNTGAIVEHDCKIGPFSHIATGATLCGGVEVGKSTHIGAGSVVKQYLSIGDNCIIGMGSVVINNIENGLTVVGNPAKMIKERNA